MNTGLSASFMGRRRLQPPGKPTDNSFIETFNGSSRDECLNLHWFASLEEARREIERWRRDYNETRPRMALNDLTPGEFTRQYSLRPVTEGINRVDDQRSILSGKPKRLN